MKSSDMGRKEPLQGSLSDSLSASQACLSSREDGATKHALTLQECLCLFGRLRSLKLSPIVSRLSQPDSPLK